MNIFTLFLGFLLVLNIFMAASIVFLERKNATSVWAWLMVLVFIPVFGFFLYLILGKPISRARIFTWDKKSKRGIDRTVKSQLDALDNGKFEFKHEDNAKYERLIYLHLQQNDAIYTQDNQTKVYTDGHKKFDALLEDMERAEDHIHLIYYIVRADVIGRRVADMLIKKAEEGVEVRFLYDGMGSRTLKRSYIKRMRNAGVQVEAFFPPRFFDFKLNFRNHRKLAIIDGKVGYIGGFNIGDEYLGKKKKFGYWRDTHLRVEGSAVHYMQARFILDWNQASHYDIHYEDRFYQAAGSGDAGMQIVSSGPDEEKEQIKAGYIKMIMAAKEYIYLQTPYFIPDESMKDALKIAVQSGVKVKIMIPNKPDHPFVYWATLYNCGELLHAGAEIYIYQNGFLHSKTIIVDGEIATVGTANIDVRSFRLNFEVNAFLYNRQLAEELLAAFNEDIKVSTQMTKKLYDRRSIFIRFKEGISKLLTPVL